MHHWTRRLFAIAAPLLLTGCLWGPGKFVSDLMLRKDGSFILDYRGQIVLQLPPDEGKPQPWNPDSMARCHRSGKTEVIPNISGGTRDAGGDPVRPCTPSELAKAKSEYETYAAGVAERNRKSQEQMAKMFGLTGLDDASNRAFAAKLMKYAGWRSVTYVG